MFEAHVSKHSLFSSQDHGRLSGVWCGVCMVCCVCVGVGVWSWCVLCVVWVLCVRVCVCVCVSVCFLCVCVNKAANKVSTKSAF